VREIEKKFLDTTIRSLRPRMIGILRQHRVGLDEGEDLIQETVFEALRQWERIECLEAWCLVVLRNRARGRNRRRTRELEVGLGSREELEDLAPEEEAPQLMREMWIDLFNVAARTLSVRARTLLQVRYVEGYTTEETAQLLGCRANSVRKMCSRAWIKLAEAYAAGSSGHSRNRK
jgi:RNA polymerase sigma-70 factor (ECF subfamily)